MKLEIEQKETKNEYKNFKKDFKKIWEILINFSIYKIYVISILFLFIRRLKKI